MNSPEVLLDGLKFPESPRWYDDRLWLSDMHNHRVIRVDLQGRSETVAELDDKPSGLGFLKDGTLLAVLMRSSRLIRIESDGTVSTYKDLGSKTGVSLNDMVVDGRERAYVGSRANPTYLEEKGPDRPPNGELLLIQPDLAVKTVAEKMVSPNGAVITPDGNTLIVAEHSANRITAFDILEDGALTNRRLWADTGENDPDGIALDAEGAIWFGSPAQRVFQRIMPGGRVVTEIKPLAGRQAIACTLGGSDRRTLFMMTAEIDSKIKATLVDFEADKKSTSQGFVEIASVDVPGVGWP